MSDSLRDQLLKAGFSQPKPKAKKPAKKRKHPNAASPPVHKSPNAAQQSNEPKAGYTHVPATPAKKKKAKKPPAVKARAGSWSTRSADAAPRDAKVKDPKAAEERRQMKAQIQGLIDTNALKDFKGEEVYRFTLQNKIRELLVKESVRKQLASGELAITRLNGATRVIPAETATSIRAINPQWLTFVTTDKADSSSEDDDEHPIPDDLMW